MTSTFTTTHHIRLDDDRTLAVDEYGDPAGTPVLLFTSAPGSRRFDPNPEATAAASVRLLVTDRPGYGDSSPWPDDVIPSWAMVANDHVAALDQLGIDRVRVVGWSQGGLAALAMAARHNARVIDATVVGTPAPNDQVAWIPDEFVGFLAMLRNDPSSAVAALAPEFVEMAADPNAAVHGLLGGPADEAALDHNGLRQRLEAMLSIAFGQQGLGLAYDIVATNIALASFDLGTIDLPVSLVYGTDDEVVPPAHGVYYRDRLPNTKLSTPRGGHLAIAAQWPSILAGTSDAMSRQRADRRVR